MLLDSVSKQMRAHQAGGHIGFPGRAEGSDDLFVFIVAAIADARGRRRCR